MNHSSYFDNCIKFSKFRIMGTCQAETENWVELRKKYYGIMYAKYNILYIVNASVLSHNIQSTTIRYDIVMNMITY